MAILKKGTEILNVVYGWTRSGRSHSRHWMRGARWSGAQPRSDRSHSLLCSRHHVK